MSAHTPGPWDNKQIDLWGADRVGLRLGFLNTSNEQRRNEGLANARLIAAAPDLLEALEGLMSRAMLGALSDDDLRVDWGALGMSHIIAARSAIRKATGE